MLFNAGFLIASQFAWWLGALGGGVNLAIVFVVAYVFLGHSVYERINGFYESRIMRIHHDAPLDSIALVYVAPVTDFDNCNE